MRADDLVFAAFGLGGAETMILGQLLRKHWGELLREHVTSEKTRLTMVTFVVPDYFPYPYLEYDVEDLTPRSVADAFLDRNMAA